MDKHKVLITDKQKEIKIPSGTRMLIRRACNAVLIEENFDGDAEVYVNLVDANEIHKLNKEFRDVDRETDVLSFPLGENGIYDINPESGAKMLGDIVLSIPRAFEQADEFGHSVQREIAYLTVHSMLHLLGYDHVNGGLEEVRMREKEEKVMIELGLPRTTSYSLEEI